MYDTLDRPTERAALEWSAVPGAPHLVWVAERDGAPVAVLEFLPWLGFRLTSCSGQDLGVYASLEEGQSACADALG